MKIKSSILITLLIVGVLALAACGGNTVETEPTESGEVVTLYVGPELAECTGEGPQTCMMVKETPDGEYQYFYSQIEGFTYEAGYEYELKVQVTPVENPPAGGSSLQYTLVEQVSKTPAAEAGERDVVTMYVGPELVECTGVAPQTCMQIKYSPDEEYQLFYGQIEGFTFEEGYDYELQVAVTDVENPPADGSALKYTLLEEVSKTPAGATASTMPASEAAGDTTLTGTYWTLSSYANADGAMVNVLPGTDVTAVFAQNGSLAGNAGCNTYTTSYEVDSNTISISDAIAATMMMCPEPIMQQETAYLANLTAAASFAIAGDTLTLSDASGTATAVFTAQQPTSLAGTNWEVTGYNNGKEAVVSVILDTSITAVFGEDGTLSGNASCNTYSAPYEVDGRNITIGMGITTMMACPGDGVMEQETAYLAAIATAATYSIQGDVLELRTADGALAVSYAAVQPASLTANAWQVTGYNNGNEAVVSVVNGTSITAVFGEDGTLSGNASCNTYNAPYEVNGSNITIGLAATTMMACPGEGVMEQENAYLAAISTAATYSIQGDVLELRTADGALAVSYTAAQPAELAVLPWLVTSYNNGKGAAVSPMLDTELTLEFQEDGNISGNAGCNRYFGPYVVTGDAVQIGPLATTRALCPEPAGVMEQEQEFLAALQAVATFTMQNDKLDLRKADGAIAIIAIPNTPLPAEVQALVENATFKNIAGEGMEPVTLSNGIYQEAIPDSAASIYTSLLDEAAFGQIDGQPAAAVTLATNTGGTGTYVDLAVVTFADGAANNVATIMLGDRVQVNSVEITADGNIVVAMVEAGPDDPLCCPTQHVINTYALQDGQLVEISSVPA